MHSGGSPHIVLRVKMASSLGRLEVRAAGDAVYLRRLDGGGVEGEEDSGGAGSGGGWWAFSADAASGALLFAPGGPPDDPAAETLHADALYGAFRLLAGDYVAVVTKSRRIARAPAGSGFVHQIEGMRWLPVRRRAAEALSAEEREEEEVCVAVAAATVARGRCYPTRRSPLLPASGPRPPPPLRSPPLPPALPLAARAHPRAAT